MFSGAAGAADRSRFSNRGISFLYPSSWFATSKPLSNGLEPVYRFAVANFDFRRTPRDVGPCLAGVARQRPATAVLAFMREAVGTDARRTRAGQRPKAFPLPRSSDQAACLGPGTNQIVFRQAGRIFYLWISVGRHASQADRLRLATLLASMKIAPS